MKLFRKSMPLNSLEKFMLAHESETVSYNSQICIEFEGLVNKDQLLSAIEQFINIIPLLRTTVTKGFLNFKRQIKPKNDLDINRFLIFKDSTIIQEDIDSFSQMKFNLSEGHNFCILVSRLQTGKNILIFNVHHSLCDAAGQFLLLEEFFRILNGLPVREEAKTTQVFRYRSLVKYLGIKWVFNNFLESFRTLKAQRNYQMATLVDNLNEESRKVSSKTYYLNQAEQDYIIQECKKRDISITEYITVNCFKAMDEVLISRNDFKTPIMVYLPKTLRPFLKIRYSFQNILSTVVIVGKRNEINQDSFFSKVKHIINSHKMDKASKFIFSTLFMTALTPVSKLQKFYRELDLNPNSITSSLLISAGRVPRSFTFPNNWIKPTVWARGTMLKSPGIGVIYTGVLGSETLTIEYLKFCTNESTINLFQERLLKNILNQNELLSSSLPEAKVGYEIPSVLTNELNTQSISV